MIRANKEEMDICFDITIADLLSKLFRRQSCLTVSVYQNDKALRTVTFTDIRALPLKKVGGRHLFRNKGSWATL
jgi:hypothetical protein